MTTATREKREQREQAIEKLREWLKPGDTVTTVLLHCSRSGMQRTIEPVIAYRNQDGTCEPMAIGWAVARALDWRFDRDRGGVKVSGCGMDMGFHLVYTLSRVLFPDGYVPADAGRNYGRNSEPTDVRDMDGGYALTQRWL